MGENAASGATAGGFGANRWVGNPTLLRSERPDRIQPGGAAGRQVRGRQAHGNHQDAADTKTAGSRGASPTTRPSRVRGEAPSAARIPISQVRWLTARETTPYRPPGAAVLIRTSSGSRPFEERLWGDPPDHPIPRL
jgi:hypothetical protein